MEVLIVVRDSRLVSWYGHLKAIVMEREGESTGELETDRQADRQAGRLTDRQIDR